MLPRLVRRSPKPLHLHSFLPNTPQTPAPTRHGGAERDVIRAVIARIAVVTHALAVRAVRVGLESGMLVEDGAVGQVEQIPTDDGSPGHETPIETHAGGAEGVDQDGREDAEEDAVGDAREAREEEQVVGLLDREREDLGEDEDAGGYDEHPDPGQMVSDQPVAADAGRQTAQEGAEGEQTDVHELALLDEVVARGIVVVVP